MLSSKAGRISLLGVKMGTKNGDLFTLEKVNRIFLNITLT